MINFNDVNWHYPGVKQSRIDSGILDGMPVALILDGIVVDTLGVDRWFAELLESATSFSEQAADETTGTYIVDILQNGSVLDSLLCGEKLYAILMSDPVVVGYTLDRHKYAEVIAVGWHYVNDDFIIPGELE